MRRLFYLFVFHVPAFLLLAGTGRAQEPQFHYQGKLITTNGLPFSGSIDVAVNVHTQDTGGIAVYTEAVGTVPVQQGLYAFHWLSLIHIDAADE